MDRRRAGLISRARVYTDRQDLPSLQGQNPKCTGNGAETSSTCLSSPRPNSPVRPSSSQFPFLVPLHYNVADR